jgi:hypothetical protein
MRRVIEVMTLDDGPLACRASTRPRSSRGSRDDDDSLGRTAAPAFGPDIRSHR